MSVETDLVTVLQGLVSNRVFPIEAEQDDVLPYIVYELVSSIPVEAPDTGEEINESVLDVAYHADTYAAGKTLAESGKDAILAGFESAVIEDTNDQRDADTRRKIVIQTFRIWHLEAFP